VTLVSDKFLLGRRLGPSSVLGYWWPSSRPKGLRKALFRLSSPWPAAGQLQVVTRNYTASDVLNAQALGCLREGVVSTEQYEDR